MKVIERRNKVDFQFRVVESVFLWDGSQAEPGQVVTLQDNADTWGMVQRGKILPTDLEDGQTFITLRSIVLPGSVKRHEAKPLELVSLLATDALRLMLAREVLPANPGQWRPFKIRLARSTQAADLIKRDELSAAQHAANVERLTEQYYPNKKKK